VRKRLGSAIAAVVVIGSALIATGCAPDEEYVAPAQGRVTVVVGKPSGDNSGTKNTGIEAIYCPGDEQQHIGRDREVHSYPEERIQRYYLVTTDEGRGDRPGPDSFTATTADGVRVKIEGKYYFHTNLSCKGEGEKMVRDFEAQYGARSFPIVGGGGTDSSESAAPWDGSPGWDAFLDINVRPDMDNVVPESVNGYTCAQLNTACAVIAGAKNGEALVDAETGKKATAAREALQKQIVDALNEQLKESMGAQYLTFTDFRISRVTLPGDVQKAVDDAQAEYAKLSGKQAELANAKLDAEKQELLSRAYDKSPALIQLEIAKLDLKKWQLLLEAQQQGKINEINVDTRKTR
jgi:hypothetical protein